MKRITLTLLGVLVIAPCSAAIAQQKESPKRAGRPDAVRKIPWDMPPMALDMRDLPDMSDLGDLAMELDMHLKGIEDMHFEDMHFEDMALHAKDMLSSIDVDRLTANADVLARKAEELGQRMNVDVGFGFDAKSFGRFRDDEWTPAPSQPWAKDDPADSLYRVAREALNRGEYRRAAQIFSDITQKFPKSAYAQDSRYWEAFSRYRLGGTDDLKEALRILDAIPIDKTSADSRESSVDIPALKARVQGALAARGDRDSEARLKREAAQNDGCDREEVSVRAEALAALGQMDMQAAWPVVKKVLARRDECTVELRRRALYMVGRQADSSAAAVILDVARNDPDAGIRGEAMRWLPRVAGDAAVPQLEDMVKTSTDEQSQRAAVYALSVIDSDRGRRALRALIERPDVAERVRYEAVLSLSRERDGRSVSADDLAYLRSLYGKLTEPRIREAVLTSLSRVDTPENRQFLVAVVRDQNEQPSLRISAMQRLGRMQSMSASDIASLYAVADARSLREQILYALSQRKEAEAIDKLIDIARKDTDPAIRRVAISLLARSNNDRAKKLLQDIIDQ
ncbi:MAG TPA: HEAT repeat domain-containing protein [Gemmatimonadaceae bacterium]|nr:HEAT repeat domain-containing protein [Gemmatimonadaceae bacterium]